MTSKDLKKLRGKLKMVNGGAYLDAVQNELERKGKAIRDKKWISKVLNGHGFSIEIIEAAVSVADKNEMQIKKLSDRVNGKTKFKAS
jgi:hypothetical protein